MSSDAPLIRWSGEASRTTCAASSARARRSSTRIHPSDEMFGYEIHVPYRTRETAAVMYLATGHRSFRLWKTSSPGGSRASRACAPPRLRQRLRPLTRFLVRAGAGRIAVSEIDRPRWVPGGPRHEGSMSRSDPGLPAAAGPSTWSSPPPSSATCRRPPSWHRSPPSVASSPGGLLVFSMHGIRLLPRGSRCRIASAGASSFPPRARRHAWMRRNAGCPGGARGSGHRPTDECGGKRTAACSRSRGPHGPSGSLLLSRP